MQETEEREKDIAKASNLTKAELHEILDLLGIARGSSDEGKKVLLGPCTGP